MDAGALITAAFIVGVIWLFGAGLWFWVDRSPIRDRSEFWPRAIERLMQIYARVVHKLEIQGAEHAEAAARAFDAGRPVIVVCNHTAGVDPILVQATLRFEPRWMMAQDMRAPELEWLWQMAHIIFVDRSEQDARSLRTAMAHLAAGNAIGIFPEGHIERPPQHLLPFKEGLGLMVRRSGALVLPMVIDGAPQIDPAWASLWKPSRSKVRCLEPIDFAARSSSPKASAIVAEIFNAFRDATGWPVADRLPKTVDGVLYTVGIDGVYVGPDGSRAPFETQEAPEPQEVQR